MGEAGEALADSFVGLVEDSMRNFASLNNDSTLVVAAEEEWKCQMPVRDDDWKDDFVDYEIEIGDDFEKNFLG